MPRTFLLATIAVATALTLGKSLVDPATTSARISSYDFPESITLSKWQLLKTESIAPHVHREIEYISGDFLGGKRYRYRQQDKTLEIEMRYFANTNGNLKDFVTSKTGDLSSVLKQDKQGGYYSLYTFNNRGYLSACINSRGNSTVTSDRFNRNLMTYDTRLSSIVPWLLGQRDFRDKRCLWAHLSMPLNSQSVRGTYIDLETVWIDWHNRWQTNFPNL